MRDSIELFITYIQMDEINNISIEKSEHAREILELIKIINPKEAPIPAIVGVAKVGSCVVVSDEDKYRDLLINTTYSNIEDALIGSTANRINCSVITDDKRFINKLKNNSIRYLCFNDFLSELGITIDFEKVNDAGYKN